MKKNILFLVITVLTLFSCADPGGDPIFDGFEFDIRNKTNKDYSIEIVIGGIQNGNFIATDSIKLLPEIQMNNSSFYFTEEDRWRSNLNKIRTISSESCFFKIKLSSQRIEIIKKNIQSEALSLKLPNGDFFEGDYGRLIIAIWDNEVTGYTPKEL